MSKNPKPKKMARQTKTLLILGTILLLLVPLARTTSARIDNNYQENTPLVLYDDNIEFWSMGGAGQGNINAAITSSNSTVKNGNSSLQINLTTGQNNYVEVGHQYSTGQNWSNYQNLCFWFYGSNTQNSINLALAAPDSYHQYWVTFNDNFSGWANIIIPLISMNVIGTATFTNVTEIGFFFYNAPNTFNIDRLILDTDSQPINQPTQKPFIPIYPTNTPAASMPSTAPSPSAALSEWLTENWRWVALLAAVITIAIAQVVIRTRKKQTTAKTT